jgi:signal transduction histidine kinase/predicted negative regulator of RcsB-dependent stress response
MKNSKLKESVNNPISNIATLENTLVNGQINDKEKTEVLIELSKLSLGISSEKSLEFALQALDLSVEMKDDTIRRIVLKTLGDVYFNSCKYEEALRYHKDALILFELSDDRAEVAMRYDNIGTDYYELSSYDMAMEFQQKALKIFEELQNLKDFGMSSNRIGLIYWKVSNFDKALEYFQRSLKALENIDDKKGIAILLNNIGLIYYEVKDNDKALEYYAKSLIYMKDNADKDGVAMVQNNIGLILYELNDFEESLKCYHESLNLSEEIGNKKATTNTLTNIGDLYVKQKKYDKALYYLEKSRSCAVEFNLKELLIDCYKTMSKVHYESKNFEKAYEYLTLFTEIKDEIFSETSNQKIANLQSKYEIENKEKEIEIHKLKNIELVQANQKIQDQREHLNLINKILRHDLKNNLTVIFSAIRIFLRQEKKEVLEEAIKKIEQSNELIDKMRVLEKLLHSNENLKSYSIKDIFNDVLKNYCDKSINLQSLDRMVLADEKLYSVFDNIISNAFTHGKTPKLDIFMREEKDDLIIEIADFGKGIPDNIKNRIFEESFTHGKTGKTGLGLFIVMKALRSYEGSVVVNDNKPSGAVFVVKLKMIR